MVQAQSQRVSDAVMCQSERLSPKLSNLDLKTKFDVIETIGWNSVLLRPYEEDIALHLKYRTNM